MTLSKKTKESIKTALAMTIAYGIGLSLDWDRPYWAGFAVTFVSLGMVGQSINKAALRMSGTVLAMVVALPLDRVLGVGVGLTRPCRDHVCQINLNYFDLGDGDLSESG
ncbi:MAG: FUSC family protein, partial [Gammaproteobacteria bacterium]